MSPRTKKLLTFGLRWGVAVVGVWWVVSNLSLRDHVLVLDDRQRPQEMVLLQPAGEDSPSFIVQDRSSGRPTRVERERVVNAPDRQMVRVQLELAGPVVSAKLLGLRLVGDINRHPQVAALLIADPHSADPATAPGLWIKPAQAYRFQLNVPRPRVETGLASMVRQADPRLLWAAVVIFPLNYVITSWRWQLLLRALGIYLPMSRTFVLNMVGSFYSTFMPGTTGGDVLKAWYASKQTPHRTQAVMSVLIDRIIGLLALIVLGGVMAGWLAFSLYASTGNTADPVFRICAQVAGGAAVIIVGLAVGLFCFFQPTLRRVLGLDYLLTRLPMQKQVQHIIEVMAAYRQRPRLIVGTLLMSTPVHLTTVLSAMLAGWAFNLPLSPGYYFIAVPVIVLASSIPISPQGAGVMEFFAILLTSRQGATVSEAVALAMSIRLVAMLWNLSGGFFVLRGGYHAPSDRERRELEGDEGPEGSPQDPRGQIPMTNR